MDSSDALGCLGSIVLAMNLMPYVSKKEYLHVSTVCTVMRDSYAGFTDLRETRGLSDFTSMCQLKQNVASG